MIQGVCPSWGEEDACGRSGCTNPPLNRRPCWCLLNASRVPGLAKQGTGTDADADAGKASGHARHVRQALEGERGEARKERRARVVEKLARPYLIMPKANPDGNRCDWWIWTSTPFCSVTRPRWLLLLHQSATPAYFMSLVC